MPNTPNINLQNGQVTGTLQNGQTFYWYNPTQTTVTVNNCGTWAAQSSYTCAPGYTSAVLLSNPNTNGYAFTESPNEWNTPGMPHVGNPPFPSPLEREKDKEVA